ncbi:hypothetical protein PROFUN_01568 [Planoprotostelium fungivorum]|uniref:Uncharacterized protein n=1 Tax=Planoprotostelium fungivorum TaxID=1890364 RepID=A0A2P6NTP2_9EUKA|nr:hypothetical protein PROFUN_01568 [Planoprotostelium fungivorum]
MCVLACTAANRSSPTTINTEFKRGVRDFWLVISFRSGQGRSHAHSDRFDKEWTLIIRWFISDFPSDRPVELHHERFLQVLPLKSQSYGFGLFIGAFVPTTAKIRRNFIRILSNSSHGVAKDNSASEAEHSRTQLHQGRREQRLPQTDIILPSRPFSLRTQSGSLEKQNEEEQHRTIG